MTRRTIHFLTVAFAVAGATAAAPPASAPQPQPQPEHRLPSLKDIPIATTGTADALAGSLRGYLARSLPEPLYERSENWGHTVKAGNGVKWRGKGLAVHPEIAKAPKNHGTWRRVRISADKLADTLVFDLRDLQVPEPGRMTFTVFVSFDASVHYEQQNWESGLRLYSGSVDARLRLKLSLECEVSVRLETGGAILPDAVFRLGVSRASLSYDNFVVKHIAGVGGELAKLLGDALKRSLHQWRPSLEQELLTKADAAIVKAADAKEIHLSLRKLFAREPTSTAPKPAAQAGQPPAK